MDEPDFLGLVETMTNYIRNERVRAYNEGMDAERSRCGGVLHAAIVKLRDEGTFPKIEHRLREIESRIVSP